MKHGDYKKITIIDSWGESKQIDAQFLGKGAFATCYHVNESVVYSFVKNGRESDYSKEAISLFCNQNNPYIPKIDKLGIYGNDTGILYSMPYYHPLKAQHKDAWHEFKTLKLIHEQTKGEYIHNNLNGYEFNNAFIANLRGHVSDDLLDALININDSCADYGLYYRFEFATRNLKVDSSGHLILLDVIFNAEALYKFNQ